MAHEKIDRPHKKHCMTSLSTATSWMDMLVAYNNGALVVTKIFPFLDTYDHFHFAKTNKRLYSLAGWMPVRRSFAQPRSWNKTMTFGSDTTKDFIARLSMFAAPTSVFLDGCYNLNSNYEFKLDDYEQDLDVLSAFPLRELKMSDFYFGDLTALVSGLPYLTSLYMNDGHDDHRGDSWWPDFIPSLQKLYVNGQKMTFDGARNIAKHVNLVELSLCHYSLADDNMTPQILHLHQLQVLKLRQIKGTDGFLRQLDLMRKLKRLSLSCCAAVTDQGLAALANFHLEHLHLECTNQEHYSAKLITDDGLNALLGLSARSSNHSTPHALDGPINHHTNLALHLRTLILVGFNFNDVTSEYEIDVGAMQLEKVVWSAQKTFRWKMGDCDGPQQRGHLPLQALSLRRSYVDSKRRLIGTSSWQQVTADLPRIM